MRTFARSAALAAFILTPAIAGAESVVGAGGKPGVATSWAKSGTAVTLTIKEGFVAEDIAEAITKAVPGAKSKAAGNKITVTGVDQAKLLLALEKVDVEAGDDVNGMFTSLQNRGGGGEEQGSGSSIRASKATDFSAVMGGAAPYDATVIEVKYGRYPNVAVTVKIDAVPEGAKDEGVTKGAKVVVLPRIEAPGGAIDPADKQSSMNIGAWYARPGDKVLVRLEAKNPKNGWFASSFERKPK